MFLSDINKSTTQTIFGFDGHGIGAVAVHPSRQFIAVADKGVNPNIYIYSFPDLQVRRILRKGTERAYSDVSFRCVSTQ